MTAPLIAVPTYHLGLGRVGNWEGAYALPEPYVAALRAAGARTEASGTLTLDRAREVAATGVDHLAVGALTHSAPALDIGLDLRG